MRFCAMYRRLIDIRRCALACLSTITSIKSFRPPKSHCAWEKKRNDEPKEWLGWVAEYVGGCQGKGTDEYESPVAHHNRNRMFFHIGTKIRVYIIYSPGKSWSLLTSS